MMDKKEETDRKQKYLYIYINTKTAAGPLKVHDNMIHPRKCAHGVRLVARNGREWMVIFCVDIILSCFFLFVIGDVVRCILGSRDFNSRRYAQISATNCHFWFSIFVFFLAPKIPPKILIINPQSVH